jgi:hypothetical protein
MADGQKPNKPLFSQHYLEHRIQECPEWQVDVRVGFEAFNTLYLSKKDLLPTLSEAQTEEVFIKPALDILGFSHIPQVTTRGKGRAERPDYALFTGEADRDAAYPLQNDEPAFYARVKAIAEAKYWERPLSKVTSNDQRDIYKNANPSFQISSYLTGTGVDWGILTNGREWRLYYRQASSTATEFYPVDLVELLESGDLEQFKYFWLFFRQAALVKDPQGRNFLERVREGSTTYAARVGNELKALVFDLVVSHTLKPILEQRQAQFGELMEQIAQLHTQLKDKRLGTQSQNGLRKDLQRLEREAQSTLLDIKVCDPAMGSGHFLVEAVDYLTDELIRILTLYPEQNPVLEMLEQTRQSILQNLEQQGITIDTLTNKSKIKNYLGNYHKKVTGSADDGNDTGEPHLGFDALIDLLKKNKKKIKIDPTARKEQQTLEKEYQASLDTLLPIKMKLMRCDRLIDQIVYKLYGLTEEEIAIVESRHVAKKEESEQYADG